jgi:hypothetical protein
MALLLRDIFLYLALPFSLCLVARPLFHHALLLAAPSLLDQITLFLSRLITVAMLFRTMSSPQQFTMHMQS